MIPLLLTFLAYITVFVAIGGILYRIFNWASASPRRYVARKQFDDESLSKPTYIAGRIVKGLILELLLMRRVFRASKRVWFITLLFHWSLIGMVFGHIRVFTEYPVFFWQLLGITTMKGMESFSATAGITVGMIFIITLAILLLRRVFVEEIRIISIAEDYTLLILLFAKGIMGQGQRFFTHISLEQLEALRIFWLDLLVFKIMPVPITDPWFMAHFALVLILIMYLPFSKLIHVLGNLIATIIVSKEGNI